MVGGSSVAAEELADIVNRVLGDISAAEELCTGVPQQGKLIGMLNDFLHTRYSEGDITSASYWTGLRLDGTERDAAAGAATLFAKVVKLSYEQGDPFTPATGTLTVLSNLNPHELCNNPNKDSVGHADFEALSTRDKLSFLLTIDRQLRRDYMLSALAMELPMAVKAVREKSGNELSRQYEQNRLLDLVLRGINGLYVNLAERIPEGYINAAIQQAREEAEKVITAKDLEMFASSADGVRKLVEFFQGYSIAKAEFKSGQNGKNRQDNVVSIAVVDEVAVRAGHLHKGLVFWDILFGAALPSMNVIKLVEEVSRTTRNSPTHDPTHPYYDVLSSFRSSPRDIRREVSRVQNRMYPHR